MTPSQLLLGYNPVYLHAGRSPRESATAQLLQDWYVHQESPPEPPDQWPVAYLSLKEERQDFARGRFIDHYLKEARKAAESLPENHWTRPENRDLVILRRFALAVDRSGNRKFEPRWEGPFRFTDVSHHRRTGRLRDLHTNELVRVRASGT